MNTAETGLEGPEATVPRIELPMFWVELVSCIVLLTVSGLYIADALQLPKPMNASDVGAGRFPLIAGSGVAIATALLLVRTIIVRVRGEVEEPVTVGRPLWVVVGVVLLVLQAELFEIAGALPVVLVSCLLIMLACGERRPVHLIASPILLVAMIYGLFTLALGIQLP